MSDFKLYVLQEQAEGSTHEIGITVGRTLQQALRFFMEGRYTRQEQVRVLATCDLGIFPLNLPKGSSMGSLNELLVQLDDQLASANGNRCFFPSLLAQVVREAFWLGHEIASRSR